MSKTANPPAKVGAAVKRETIKPEKLPVDIGNGRIEFLKRGEYAKRTAENFSILTKSEIRKSHVEQVLEGLDKGQTEMPEGDNPKEFHDLFDKVKSDYEDAVTEVQRLVNEEAEKKDKAERDAKELAEKQEKLFLSIKDKNPNLGDLASKFDTGNMDRFIPKKDVSTEDLLSALNTGLKLGEFNGWMIGDLVVAIEDRGQLNVVGKLAESNGIAYSKVYNDSKTSRLIPPEKRVKGVSRSIFYEIANAKFSKDDKGAAAKLQLVDKATSGEYTTQTVRAAVKTAQGKTDVVKLPEEDEKKEFIVVDPNAELEFMVQITKGFPKELSDNGAKVINPSTKLVFAGFGKKPENRWVALSEYKRPEVEKAPAAVAGGKRPAPNFKKKAGAKK